MVVDENWVKIKSFFGSKNGVENRGKKHRFLGRFFTDRHTDNLDNVEEKNIKIVVKKNILYIKKTLALSKVEC